MLYHKKVTCFSLNPVGNTIIYGSFKIATAVKVFGLYYRTFYANEV